ncbi:MAG: DnaB-like helicase C-terminal domain-containing protein, partial [Planctomycetota bacterium]
LRLGVVARVERGALTIARMPALVGAGAPASDPDDGAVLWDPIVSIEPLGPKQVYDLTIPETHNFVANDICIHNTTYAINVLRNVAVGRPGSPAGHGCVFFSLEMPKVQIVSNLLCSMAKVDSHRLRGGFLSREEEQNLLDWGEVLEKQPIYIDDTPGLSVMELRGKARRLRAEGKIECILIDYLQLMQGDLGSSQKARHEVVAEISRSLKALARELEVPVIALAQLNRNVEDRPDHRPRMADLRECVTGDTLVVLADGRRAPIKDLVGQTPEVIAMQADGKLAQASSDRVWSVGRRPVFDVRLASGRTIRATARHRLYSGTGWRRLSQLAVDDRIAVARLLPEPNDPEVWDEDRLTLLGHLVGDGSYLSGKPIRYTTSSEANSDAVAGAARRAFGLTVNRHAGRGRWHQLVLSGNGNRWHPAGINLWFRQLGIFNQRSHQKRLPGGVFRLASKQVEFLLRHLWATDGCIHVPKNRKGAPRVFFATNSAGLAGDVTALLLRLGIVARTRIVKQGQYRPLYSVDVSGAADQRRFLETVGGFGPRAEPAKNLAARLESVQPNTNVDTLPVEVFQRVRSIMGERGITQRRMAQLRGTSYGGTSHFRFAPSRATVESYGTLLEDEVLLQACRSDLFWDRIVAITPAGTEEVFDLTVPGPASWLADGIVSHNSGSIEQDADVIMLLHRDEYYMKREQAEAENKVNKAQVLIQKNRNGPVGDVELYYAKEFSYFGELQR